MEQDNKDNQNLDKNEILANYFMSRFRQMFALPDDNVDGKKVENLLIETLEQMDSFEPKKKLKRKNTRSISRYNIFSKEQFEKLKDEPISHRDKMRLIGQRWKNVTEDEKKYYEELAQLKNQDRNKDQS